MDRGLHTTLEVVAKRTSILGKNRNTRPQTETYFVDAKEPLVEKNLESIDRMGVGRCSNGSWKPATLGINVMWTAAPLEFHTSQLQRSMTTFAP